MLWGAGSFWAIGLATINEISAISPKMTAIENFMMICCEYGVALRTVDLTTVAYLFIKVVYIPFISIARYIYIRINDKLIYRKWMYNVMISSELVRHLGNAHEFSENQQS